LWQIPQPIADAIRYHHEPERAVDPGAWVVTVADAISHKLQGNAWPCSTTPETVAWALEALGLTEEQVIDRAEKTLRRAGLLD
jgi:HD-like signal output (HDOD) protein